MALGEYSNTAGPGLNFAPWPFMTYQIVATTTERTESIGSGGVAGMGGMAGSGGMGGMGGSGGMSAMPKPDFKLIDTNPNSPTVNQEVSPSQFLGKVSAWYFGHGT